MLRFEFTYTLDDSTTVIQDYSELNTVTFIPNQPGNYSLGVNVMDGNGNIASKTIEDFLIIGDTSNLPSLNYRTHVENVGWQDFVTSGQMSGTSGRGLRLEGIEIKIDNSQNALGIKYTTHVQNIGWQDMVENGNLSGTSGLGLRLEAIQIQLTGLDADQFDIYYRVHAQNVGWMGWAKNGAQAGTAGYGYRLEGIEIQIVEKGTEAPGNTTNAFIEKVN